MARLKSLNVDCQTSHPLTGLVNRDCRQFIGRLAVHNMNDKSAHLTEIELAELHMRFCKDIVEAYYKKVVHEADIPAYNKRIAVRRLQKFLQDVEDYYEEERVC